MNMNCLRVLAFLGVPVALITLAGCIYDNGDSKPVVSVPPAESKKVSVGKNIHLEIVGEQRRVLLNAYVCLRRGQLEQFLTRKNTKEHEAVLASEVDARQIHAALILANATPGKTVQFDPNYKPATGTPIKITLEYKDEKGKLQRVPAQQWIRNIKTQKDMTHHWVFGGSMLIADPLDKQKQPFYAANDGDVICLSNFQTAMLDLPVSSPQENADLIFEANTDRIPPMNTPVTVVLEPMTERK